jgi:hypothetical protein
MSRYRFVVAVVLLCVIGDTVDASAGSSIFLRGRSLATAAVVIRGTGLPLPDGVASSPLATTSGASIVWVQLRTATDNSGCKHVFYRQHLLLGSGTDAEMEGSEVGAHFDSTGALVMLGGTQVTELPDIYPAIVSPVEAVTAAATAFASTAPNGQSFPGIGAIVLLERAARAKLIFGRSTTTKEHFYFVTEVVDNDGTAYQVYVDAATGQIERLLDAGASMNCSVSTPTSPVAVSGHPVRPEPATRSLSANLTASRGIPFSAEGYKQSTSASPAVIVFQQTSSLTPSTLKCASDDTPSYTVFPLQPIGGSVMYDDVAGSEWRGRIAGDAMYQTYKTMAALSGMGRNSWNNAGTDARIIIESDAAGPDNARFSTLSSVYGPANSVYIGKVGSANYNYVAALDSIGHEWGHGVINSSANFQTTTVGQQMAEGWADVIGQLVEKKSQPTGTGVEQSSDWNIAEDTSSSGQYIRGADLDDGSGHTWAGRLFNSKFHKDDVPAGGSPQEQGNMLNVVYKLLTVGGRNPWCATHGTAVGCAAGFAVQGRGLTVASKILFTTLVNYLPSTVLWTDLSDYAMAAAFDLYNRCSSPLNPGPALLEQQSTDDAFRSIGYPSAQGLYGCP